MSSKKVRKSPQQSATLYSIGTIKSGLDGNKWIIVKTSTGVKRWKIHKRTSSKTKTKSKRKRKTGTSQKKSIALKKDKLVKSGKGNNTNSFIKRNKITNKSYLIHDNGGTPFKVIVSNDNIKIYTYKDSDTKIKEYDVLLLTFPKFTGYWYGYDMLYHDHGNSILIQLTPNQYVYVGSVIQSFETSEEILDYMSPLGNSDVPYPVAYSDNYVYFMLDNKYVKKDKLETDAIAANASEIYGEFYKQQMHKKSDLTHKFKKLKTLVKRRV